MFVCKTLVFGKCRWNVCQQFADQKKKVHVVDFSHREPQIAVTECFLVKLVLRTGLLRWVESYTGQSTARVPTGLTPGEVISLYTIYYTQQHKRKTAI